jgi:hypothetical protein
MYKQPKSILNIIFTLIFLLSACKSSTTEVTPQSAILSESSGNVSVQPEENQEFIDAKDGDVLNAGGQVKTGQDGRVRLDLSTGTILRVGPSSIFKLISNTSSDNSLITKMKLELGKMWIILNGGDFDIETPSGQASVRGSYMSVDYQDGLLRVTCLEGTCTFRNNTGDYVIPPGFVLECTGPDDAPTITAMTEADIQEWLAVNPEAAEVVAALLASASSTPTIVPTATITFTPSATATTTITPTSTPLASLEGEIQADLLSCRYGPGASYLYQYGFSKGASVEVLGKAETADGLWIYIKHPDYEKPCWVNARFMQVDGDATALEQIYPDQTELILFIHPKFPPPTNGRI